jgi:hypothetical protein
LILEKIQVWWRGGLKAPVLLVVYFEGGFGKCGAQRWCFCGEVVVDCAVNVVSWMVVFGGRKHANFLENIFGLREGAAKVPREGKNLPGAKAALRPKYFGTAEEAAEKAYCGH